MMRALVAFVSILLLALGSNSASAQKAIEPEYIDTFFALNPVNGTLVPLERQIPATRTRVKALGLRGAEGLFEVAGEKSPVRFTSGSVPDFVVRLASRDKDPTATLQFFSFQQKDGKRSMVYGTAGVRGGRMSTAASDVKFVATKYGEASFKVSAASPLVPGEYALSTVEISDVFFFGVDGGKAK